MQENKMGTMKINKLVITMALPMIVSMLVQSLYNIVDSIFVAQYSKDAFTALSLCFPVQSIMISLAVGTGVGINSLMSRRLGEHRPDLANKAAVNGIFLAFCTSVLVAVMGFFLSKSFIAFFTDTPATIKMGNDYLSICTVFSVGVFMQITVERLLQSTGRMSLSMITQVSGAVINIILDPIMIFGYLGCPEMGAAGAALATVIGQWCGAVIGFWLNHKYNKEINVSLRKFRPDMGVIRDIYRVGLPSIIMQSLLSVMTIGMNKILDDDVAISVFGSYFKVNNFAFMPVFGLSNAIIPICAYNFGARKKDRINGAMKLGFGLTTAFMLFGSSLVLFFPDVFLKMFNADLRMLEVGMPALRIIASGFVFAGVCIMTNSLLQAINSASYSVIISVLRLILIPLPSAFLLKYFFGLSGVWFSMPLSELVGGIFCVIYYIRICKPKINSLER